MRVVYRFMVLTAFFIAMIGTAFPAFSQTEYTWKGGVGSWHSASNWNPTGVPGADDFAVISSGTAQMNGSDAEVGNLTLTGDGILYGAGTLTVLEELVWINGEILGDSTITGADTIIVAEGGTLTIEGGGNKRLDNRVLVNNGTAEWTSGNIRMVNNARIINQAGRTFKINLTEERAINFLSPDGGEFYNYGTLIRSGPTERTIIYVNLINEGTVKVETGLLDLRRNGSATDAVYDVAAGALLQFKEGPHTLDGVTFSGLGTSEFPDAEIIANGNGITVAPEATLSTYGSGSAINGSGDIVVNGIFNWDRTGLLGSGELLNNNIVTISGDNPRDLGRNFINKGMVTWKESGTFRLQNNAQLVNDTTGTFDIQGNALMLFHDSGGGTVVNYGSMQKTGGGTTTFNVPLINAGTLNINADTLSFTNVLTNDTSGTLGGNGVLDLTQEGGGFDNQGTVNPGVSPGLLTVLGNYSQTSLATLEAEISGITPGSQYDRLNVEGQARLNGKLVLSLPDGFEPQVTDVFQVLTYRSRNSQFSEIVFDGYLFTHTYQDTALEITGIESKGAKPTAVADAGVTNEDSPITLNVLANDSDDDGDAIFLKSFSQAGNGSVTQAGDSSLTYQPNGNFFGSDTFSYIVTDNREGDSNGTVIVTVNPVNDAPAVAVPLPDVTFAEDGSDSLALAEYGADIDNAPAELSWIAEVLTAQPPAAKSGQPGIQVDPDDLQISISPDNVATFTATADSGGVFTVRFTVRDPGGLTDSDTATVTVSSVNDPPVVVNPIADVSFGEDEGPVTAVENLQSVFSDPDPDASLTFSASSNNTNIQAVIAGQGLSLNSSTNYNGSATVIVTANDGSAIVNDTIAVQVTPVNDPPTIAPAIPNITFQEDNSTNLNLGNYQTDIDNTSGELSWSAAVISAPGRAAKSGAPRGATDAADLQVSINPDTKVATFTASSDSNGVFQVVFTLSDAEQASDTDTITVTVSPINDPPVVAMQDVSFSEDGSTTIELNDFGSDIDNAPGELTWTAQVLSVVTVGKSGGSGPAVDPDDLQISIDPTTNIATLSASPDSVGAFRVEFSASDPGGLSDKDTITVTVVERSDPPVIVSAIPDVEFAEDSGPVEVVADLNTVFEDPDGDVTLLFSAESDNPDVTATVNGTALIVDASPDYFGSAVVSVSASDGGDPTTDEVAVTVTPVNDGPVLAALPAAIAIEEDDSLSFGLDTLGIDVDDSLENLLFDFAVSDPNVEDSVDVNVDLVDMIATIVPAPNYFVRGVQLIISVTDPDGLTARDTVDFSILPVNDAPFFVESLERDTIPPETTSLRSVWEVVADVETPDSLLSYSFSSGSSSLLYNYDRDSGMLTLLPAPGFTGEVDFYLTVSDPEGASVSDTVLILVQEIVVGIEELSGNGALPREFAVAQNYPNPFNPNTAIKFQLPAAGEVQLTVYNLLGQRVRTLVNERLEAGYYEVQWDALNDRGAPLSSGVYIYRFEAENYRQVRKMILLR